MGLRRGTAGRGEGIPYRGRNKGTAGRMRGASGDSGEHAGMESAHRPGREQEQL